MQYTPVIPPVPGPQGGPSSPGHPPVVPFSPPSQPASAPAWSPQPQYMSPYVGPNMYGGAPGSYFIPPVALPSQSGANPPVAPVGASGIHPDWTGFPAGSMSGSPYTHPASPGSHPQTPYMAPPTTYNAFNQQLPHGFGGPHQGMPGMWMPPMTYTPFAMPGQMPGGMPPGMPPGMHPGMHPGIHPGMAGAWGTPFPAPGAGGLPPQAGQAPPQVPAQTGNAPQPPRPLRPQDAIEFDKVDRFAEGPHYGPVLDPMLIKKVKAKMLLNPLLMPPPEEETRDYIKWNMLFSTAQCQRSSDPAHRSWARGRSAPATWPRVTSLRLISASIPWPIEITASDSSLGVTCGDVIEGIQSYMNGRVAQSHYDFATETQKRILSEAFYFNRSTAHGVPGGRLPQTLLRFDWLGQDTMFGGIVADDAYVKEVCGALLPCIFVLQCRRRYPMTEQEIEEQERREAEADARSQSRRRARSRATSRATSRAPSRGSSRPPEDDENDE
ncbi:uncharacterized protein FIBRA_06704 [Fibroporia radiculosa]|uniref:DUF6699 domain-containing protein n=1 Tax=Fibroporia radiculosa TaxID=599839 RepID=J4GC94_9APHY|nr:uncharacterized protein FIBRA_06704 [Fibroporia radiculosa]CCM04523.1 predicted protein [Fibroporia radiculosa]